VARVESYGNSALLPALIHRNAWKGSSPKSVCSIAHSPVPTEPRTPYNPVLGTKAETYMSWRRIKMRSAA
jgi:hypothetical protein